MLEYEGTAYHGWQVQKNGITIQEVLEKALSQITNTKTSVLSSGRTDAGVHAEAMPAHFITESKMKPGEFQLAINSLLPHDITIKEVRKVPMSFNARGSVKLKLYRYTILNRGYPSALNFRRSISWILRPCDVPLNICKGSTTSPLSARVTAMRNHLCGRWIALKFSNRTVSCNLNLKVRGSSNIWCVIL